MQVHAGKQAGPGAGYAVRVLALLKRRWRWHALGIGCACVAALPVVAQYPGQIDTSAGGAPSLRSVAVLEWTGDLKHPQASRIIPISVFDGQTLQDGGIYLARPAPLALDAETEYVLQQDGKKVGLFDIQGAANQGGMWIGVGKWKPLPTGPSPQELARQLAAVKIDDPGNDEPVLHRKHHAGDASPASKSTTAGHDGPAPDPDRPTLHRQDGDSSAETADSGPPPDPDRPRLHADTDTGKAAPRKPQSGDDVAHVEDLPTISDPDRPRLMRGQPAESSVPDVKPSVMGLPPDMQQRVAISDARTIKDHPWDFAWANPADEQKMKTAMEDLARKAMGVDQPAPTPAPAHPRTTARRKAPPPPPPQPVPLEDEQFRVLELAYGQGATLVMSAHTSGAGADEKFVTLIAQPDLYGSVVVLFKNVTDAAHLDLRPRMRLVDAVDAEGDNRGELLFEMRGKMQREFALYRVVRGQATQIFVTGPLGTGSAAGE